MICPECQNHVEFGAKCGCGYETQQKPKLAPVVSTIYVRCSTPGCQTRLKTEIGVHYDETRCKFCIAQQREQPTTPHDALDALGERLGCPLSAALLDGIKAVSGREAVRDFYRAVKTKHGLSEKERAKHLNHWHREEQRLTQAVVDACSRMTGDEAMEFLARHGSQVNSILDTGAQTHANLV